MLQLIEVVPEALPIGHETLRMDFPNGDRVVFVSGESEYIKVGKPLPVDGVMYAAVAPEVIGGQEWSYTILGGVPHVLVSFESMFMHVGLLCCDDAGLPMDVALTG